MKSDDYLVVCPYYAQDLGRAVCCEGIHGSMQMRMIFYSHSSKRNHKWRYCRAKWASCPWAQVQNRRYDYTP